ARYEPLTLRNASTILDTRSTKVIDMTYATRTARSFTIAPEVDAYISSTKGNRSASERVNEMLRHAMQQERCEELEAEAQAFYAAVRDAERKENRAFQAASIHAISRD
ncbi:MAG: hypothetical protein ACRD22_07680, partial [Terriglobia bacterium]